MAESGHERPHSWEEKAPKPPRGRWRGAAQLEKEFVGSHTGFTRALLELRRALEADLIAAGYSEAEAAGLVGEHLIRLRTGRDGRERPVAGDDALRLLDLADRAAAEPAAPEGWISALRLSQERGEDYHVVVRRLKRVYRDALRELRQRGYPDQLAAEEVQQNLVRCLRPVRGKRRIWIASDEAVRQLGGRDSPDETAPPRPDLRWPPGREGGHWATRLDELLAAMVAGGCSLEDAVHSIRLYLDERSKSASHAEGRFRSR